CVHVCPIDLPIVDWKLETDIRKKRLLNSSIDFGICIFYGNCVGYCPTNCLSMTQKYELSTYDRHKLNYNQIALGRLPMSVIDDYTIPITSNKPLIRFKKIMNYEGLVQIQNNEIFAWAIQTSGSGLILGILGVVLLPNPIYSAFSLGLVLVCTLLFYILSKSYFVATGQLLIYVGAINVLIIFVVMFMNGSEYYKDFHLWTVRDGITSMSTNWNSFINRFFSPFELISIVLLVGLIGAIGVARQ
ncbi:hypothetical protein H5410_003305, partial [Solanum commersonii]